MAIEPTNTDTIDVDIIREKTTSAGTSLTHAKNIESNGQALRIGPSTSHDLELQSNDTLRVSIKASTGDLEMDGTNGGSIKLTKTNTCVTPGDVSTGLTATGTTISDALDLTAVLNQLSTVPANTGAQLWDAPVNARIEVINNGVSNLNLYPHSGSGTINGGAGGAAVVIVANEIALCYRDTSTNWFVRVLSGCVAP